jgi:hypothetical protein
MDEETPYKIEVFVNGKKRVEGDAIAGILRVSEKQSDVVCVGKLTMPEWCSMRETVLRHLLGEETIALSRPDVKAAVALMCPDLVMRVFGSPVLPKGEDDKPCTEQGEAPTEEERRVAETLALLEKLEKEEAEKEVSHNAIDKATNPGGAPEQSK